MFRTIIIYIFTILSTLVLATTVIVLAFFSQTGNLPHLVGRRALEHFGLAPGSAAAHAFTYLDFAAAARGSPSRRATTWTPYVPR